MAKSIGRPAATGIALLACLLVTCLPNGLFRLNVCDCGSVVVEPENDGAACCCIEKDPTPGGDRPVDPDGRDHACCTDIQLPDLLESRTKPRDDAADDGTPAPDFAPPDPRPGTTVVRAIRVQATGPPGGYRTLRALALHRSIVLLI